MPSANRLVNDIIFEIAMAGIKPPPDLNIWECADKYRVLPKVSGYAEPGKYRVSRTPYLKEVMEVLSPQFTNKQIKIMKGTQLGFTEVINNWCIYNILFNPGPMLFVLPTVELAKRHSKKKLSKTILATPMLKGKIKPARSKDSGNTILLKEYPGGSIALAGANSAASFRSDSVRDLALDDVDGYPQDASGEGNPCDLAISRTDAYANRKVLKISTPTGKGISRIEMEYEDSDQRKYFVPCMECGKIQVLEWGGIDATFGIKFERDSKGESVRKVWYECRYCHGKIQENQKPWMLENGRWIAQNPGHPDVGFHLSTLYSPLGWRSWMEIADEFLKMKSNQLGLKSWTNRRLGLPFEEKGDQPEWGRLKARCESYEIMTVPERAFILSMGVDVQDNRLAVVIRAWARSEESFLVWFGEIFGDPSGQKVWEELDKLIERPYRHVSGVELYIVSVAVDSGGHHTQEVYSYCRARSPKVFAVKGASISGKPILGRPTKQDIDYRGKVIKNGVDLWLVGSDTAKSQIYGRLKLRTKPNGQPNPGYIHFPIGIDDEYFSQLTAEKMVTRYTKSGYPKNVWILAGRGRRNEALDCEIYALAAAIRYGIARLNWDELEGRIGKIKTEIEGMEVQKNKKIPVKIAKSKWMER